MDDQGNYLYKTSTIGETGEPYLKSNSGRDPTESVWSLQEDVLLLNRTFGIPSDLKALELDEERARALIRASYGSSMSGNPIAYSEEEWYQLFLKYDLI